MKKLFVSLLLVMSSVAFSQTGYQIGDKVANFTLTNVSDNSQLSLASFNSSKAVVIIFTSHNCPYSKIYENRIKKLISEYDSKGVKFLLVNPNNPDSHPEDAASEMAVAAKNYNAPYLADPKQQLANAFGATKTPEVMVLKNTNGTFVLKYHGAIDDNPQVESDVTSHFLREALEAVITGGVLKYSEKRATGCMIYR